MVCSNQTRRVLRPLRPRGRAGYFRALPRHGKPGTGTGFLGRGGRRRLMLSSAEDPTGSRREDPARCPSPLCGHDEGVLRNPGTGTNTAALCCLLRCSRAWGSGCAARVAGACRWRCLPVCGRASRCPALRRSNAHAVANSVEPRAQLYSPCVLPLPCFRVGSGRRPAARPSLIPLRLPACSACSSC